MPIQNFADRTAADVFHNINSKDARKVPQDVWSPARRRLALLNSAHDLRDLSQPGLMLEPLKHNRPGFYSMRITLRYRIIFRFEGGNAYDVSIENYHGRTTS